MKNRLFNNWSWIRVAYVGIGLLIIIQAVNAAQEWGLALGIYVTAMGLFSFGCAAGNCAIKPDRDHKIFR